MMTRFAMVLTLGCALLLACAGPKGDKGDTGDTGAAGQQGTPGPQGNQGPQGVPGPTKFVNLTTLTDSTRMPLSPAVSITLESFLYNKVSPTSYLLIEGTISAWGNSAGSMQQGWRLGSGTEVLAQSTTYTAQPHSTVIPTRAVITGHTTTGPQIMTFRYFAANNTANAPFNTYNPNANDDARLGQTRSVFTIWEMEP